MGAGASLPLSQVKPGFSTMCISFQYSDRITVLHLDDAGLSVIRQAITETWGSGIQNERSMCGSGWAFKLRGNPFFVGTSSETSFQARQMVCQILQKLYAIGWKITGSTDLGRFEDRSTIFLKRSSPEFSTYPFICVGLSSSDKLQFVNLPSQLIEPIKETIRLTWSLGIQREEVKNGMMEVKMSGNPWRATDQQSIMAKVLLQNIIATLRRYQWAYYCNVNLKSTADSLIFRYDSNIVPGESTPFCTISLNRYDRLRAINAPQEIISMIRRVIETTWVPGHIQDEKNYHGSWEFKLSGNPWHSTKEESVMARYLIMKILEAMQGQGWHNIAGIDISRRPTDKSVLIFQRGQPKQCPMMCLSLNDVDKFRLICMPTQIMDLFRQILLSRLSNGIQSEKQLALNFGTVYQLKLRGYPWMGGDRDDTVHARSFLCNILEEFGQQGWKLLLSADVSAKYVHQDKGPDYPIDVHSMWFMYNPEVTAQPSAPTYGFNFASAPQQYGIGMTSQLYPPPPLGSQAAGMPNLYPPLNQAPPSYAQAMGEK